MIIVIIMIMIIIMIIVLLLIIRLLLLIIIMDKHTILLIKGNGAGRMEGRNVIGDDRVSWESITKCVNHLV